jgi:uroporphyrinogen-III synthase
LATAKRLPLKGKRVVVTRAPEQAGELVDHLEELGAEVLLFPMVTFAPPEDCRPLDEAIHALAGFDWILLTSQNAVRFLCERCRMLGVQLAEQKAKPQFAAVGPATAQAVESEGLHIARVASRFRAEELAREMGPKLAGKRILLPRSDRARPDLPQALRAAGATVLDVIAYRTLPAGPGTNDTLEKISRGEVDVITLASPSAFHHLSEEIGAERLKELTGSVALAAIGPVTARAAAEVGLPVTIEASESTVQGLVRAIVEYFEKQGSGTNSSKCEGAKVP